MAFGEIPFGKVKEVIGQLSQGRGTVGAAEFPVGSEFLPEGGQAVEALGHAAFGVGFHVEDGFDAGVDDAGEAHGAGLHGGDQDEVAAFPWV